jgi:phosphohistidine phosphatase
MAWKYERWCIGGQRYVVTEDLSALCLTGGVRRLVVVRHAKAERASPRGDHGRRLSSRGRAQSAALRAWTQSDGPLGDVVGTVVVSDAARTLETFELGLAGTPVCVRGVVDPLLYNGVRDVDTDEVLDALAAADPGRGDLVLVGHSPTVAYLVEDLLDDLGHATEVLADGYPLCGVAIMTFDGDAPSRRAGTLSFFGAPVVDAE